MDCPPQMVAEFTVITGGGFTVTIATPVPVQPAAIPITVYGVVVLGETVLGFTTVASDQI